jgi:hypothetical protein
MSHGPVRGREDELDRWMAEDDPILVVEHPSVVGEPHAEGADEHAGGMRKER